MMPPSGAPRPDRATLDRLRRQPSKTRSTAPPPPRRIPGAPALHRLNRTEYGNAVRDLLDLPIDADGAAAGRRLERGLRQHGQRAQRLAGADAGLRLGGGEDQPARGRRPDDQRRPHDLSGAARDVAGRPPRRAAARHARRPARAARVSARRRVRVPDRPRRRRTLRAAAGRRRRRGRDHAERRARAPARTRRRAAASGSRFRPGRRRSASPSSAAPTRAAWTICSPSWRDAPACRAYHQRTAEPDRPRRYAEPAEDLHLPSASPSGLRRDEPHGGDSATPRPGRDGVRAADPLGARHARVPPASRPSRTRPSTR